ncbi:MAG: hypothetical protein HPY83_17480 [Anaerolineae bacterium]|nr:hypothetical protein [Anaerolineae bacterium]
MELSLGRLADGKVEFGSLTLQWLVHTERTSYRLLNLVATRDANGVTLATETGLGWDTAVSRAFRARIRLEPRPAGLDYWVTVAHPERVRAVKTVVQGLPSGSLRCVTEDGHIRIGARHRPREYPTDWATPFVWLQPDSSGVPRFVARCVPEPVSRKAFSARLRPEGDTELMLYEEAYAPRYGAEFSGSRWRLRATRSLMTELEEHGSELAAVRGLTRFDCRQDVPPWARSCDLVIKLSGVDFNGLVHLDFARMIKALKLLSRHGNLNRAVIYLVGWDGPFMRDYPRLEPARELAVSASLQDVVGAAHALGAKVVLHVNPVAASESIAMDPARRSCQAVGFYSGPVTYPARDWDGDGFVESGWVLMNPWCQPHRGWVVENCERLVRTYGVDGFFLADMQIYAPDPRGDFYAGWKALVRELCDISEDMVLLGDGHADYVPSLTPIFEPHCRADSAEFQLAVGRWGRSVAYSAVADPLNRAGAGPLVHAQHRPLKGVSPNVLPAVTIVRETLSTAMEEVYAALEWARNWDALYGADRAVYADPKGAAA